MSVAYFPRPRAVIHFRVERRFIRPTPVQTPIRDEADMFHRRLDNMIDTRHKSVCLAGLIERPLRREGASQAPTRLMVGLHFPSEKITP